MDAIRYLSRTRFVVTFLRISLGGQPIVDFVFRDERILRPYFANARVANGVQVTRNHPPILDVDAVDHDTMHPGIWLGFGDISGQDFWRNKATGDPQFELDAFEQITAAKSNLSAPKRLQP